MNPNLARLYNTQGSVKEASAAPAAQAAPEVDLNKVSAADFLDAVLANQVETPVDVSKLSDEELNKLAASIQETDQKALLEKMASSGELAYWDMAGRTMAHAYADEIQKLASAQPQAEASRVDVDLSTLSAAELLKMIDEGFEFAPGEGDDPEKVASITQAVKNWGQAAKYVGGQAASKAAKHVSENRASLAKGALGIAGAAAGGAAGQSAVKKLQEKKE